ncbi:hypothetical protein ACHAWC_003467 [Mediolabrus comicus]
MQLCSSEEECNSVADEVSASVKSAPDKIHPSREDMEEAISTLVEYLDVPEHDAKIVINSVVINVWGEEFADNLELIDSYTADNNDDEEDASDNNPLNDKAESDNDEDYVGEGECQLCERTIKLTRHHLIPKTTWPRMKKRLWNAAKTIEAYHSIDDESSSEKKQITKNKLENMLGMSDIDIAEIPTSVTHDSVRSYLSKVCLLCRQCHSAVHRIHTEMELATEFNTIDKLFCDEEILKFGKWASKQKPGKYKIVSK